MNEFKLSKRSLDKLAECDIDLQLLIIEAIKDSPYDFGVIWGYRSPVKQNQLYQQGRTEAGNIVTYVDGYNKKSKHNYNPSLAVDIAVYVDGKITWEHKYYKEVSIHMLEVAERLFDQNIIKNRIIWGGNWNKFKDLPHYQI